MFQKHINMFQGQQCEFHKGFLRRELIRKNKAIFFWSHNEMDFTHRHTHTNSQLLKNYGTVKGNTKIELQLGTCKREHMIMKI